jgi:hypothetical protein
MDVSVSDIRGRVSDGTSEIEVATDAARMAAEPKLANSGLKRLGLSSVVVGGALLIFRMLVDPDPSSFSYQSIGIKGTGAALVVLGIVSYLIGFAIDAAKDADLDQRTADWSKMWRCSRCGESFRLD